MLMDAPCRVISIASTRGAALSLFTFNEKLVIEENYALFRQKYDFAWQLSHFNMARVTVIFKWQYRNPSSYVNDMKTSNTQ